MKQATTGALGVAETGVGSNTSNQNLSLFAQAVIGLKTKSSEGGLKHFLPISLHSISHLFFLFFW